MFETSVTKTATILGVGCVLASAVAIEGELLREKDHESLGRLIGKYYEAKKEEKGIADALDDVRKEIEKIEKKSKGTPFLAMSADHQQIFYYVNDYSDSVAKGRISEESFTGLYNDTIEYVVHAPRAYRSSRGPYPVVLCIPGAGEDPEDHLEADWADEELRGEAIVAAVKMPEEEELWDEPEGGAGAVLQVFRELRNTYAADVDRVFLAGKGPGVAAAASIAATYPHVFAGVVGRSGDVEGVSPVNFRNLATYFAGGGDGCKAFLEAAGREDITNCTLGPEADAAAVWKWIKEQQRDPNPAEVSLAPASELGGRAYWVLIQGFDPEAETRLDARIDRDTNTITIESQGVDSVRLYFNDELVDLGQPVRVICNGATNEHRLARNLTQTLELAFYTNDPSRIYTATQFYDIPETE